MSKMILLFFLRALLGLIPVAYAQSPGEPDVQTAAMPAETPSMNQSLDYVYDPTGKKDPFKPYRAPRVKGDNRPAAPVDPLTLVEVNQLELVAIMWNTENPRAIIKDNQGRTYQIFKNYKVGRNEGVVADIREGQVVIVEKFDDGFGNIVREARVLEMQRKLPSESQAGAGG